VVCDKSAPTIEVGRTFSASRRVLAVVRKVGLLSPKRCTILAEIGGTFL